METIVIGSEKFQVIDALNNITLADSFLLNKTGTGNGEGKMYVGNESEALTSFFDPYEPLREKNGFFINSDIKSMVTELKPEYTEPQQTYYKKKQVESEKRIIDVTKDMPAKWHTLLEQANGLNKIIPFSFYRSDINPPRTYINSDAAIFTFLRNIGIPNVSFCSILKLKNADTNEINYYFKPFVSYSNEVEGYVFPSYEEEKEIESIKNSDKKKESVKKRLIISRVGQGKYREDLLNDMPYCPFTKINDERLLVASHIKPWVKSTDVEKIDSDNGLALSPTYDALFDKGLISFKDNGELIVSPFLTPMNQKRLNISTGKKIGIERFFTDKRKDYLKYHRNYVFKGIDLN